MGGGLRHAMPVAVCVAVAIIAALPVRAAMSPNEKLFVNHCGTCHAKEAGAPKRQGPNLLGIVGRRAGAESDFNYSQGLKHADWQWTPDRLDRWIADPKAMIPGTTMIYKQAKPETRASIIDYLQTLK